MASIQVLVCSWHSSDHLVKGTQYTGSRTPSEEGSLVPIKKKEVVRSRFCLVLQYQHVLKSIRAFVIVGFVIQNQLPLTYPSIILALKQRGRKTGSWYNEKYQSLCFNKFRYSESTGSFNILRFPFGS